MPHKASASLLGIFGCAAYFHLWRYRHRLKNPENLSDNQQIKLAWIAATDPKLYRAYLLKEGLRTIFGMPVEGLGRDAY